MNGSPTHTEPKPVISMMELRFIVIPRFLAYLLHICIMALVIEYSILAIVRNPEVSTSLASAFFVVVAWVASKYAQGYFGQRMIHHRLWHWGRQHFKTWDEFKAWFHTKSPQDIELMLIAESAKDNPQQILREANRKPHDVRKDS